MPTSVRPRAARPTAPPAGRWRSAVVVCAFLVTAAVGIGVALQHPSVGAEALVNAGAAALPPQPTGAPPPSVPPSSPSLSSSASPDPVASTPVLRLPGAVPAHGRGGFGYDDRAGGVLGRAGVLRRFRVAVENGSGEDAHAFGDAVQRALAGPGSWVDSGRLRLQRVGPGSPSDFTIYLATRDTAGRLCRAGGIDLR
ncbi:DUF3152 domain-containing protein, partial [Micromonospora sp. AMSO31t]|uniref:DUF3152 domain-containing protein n=1 Tax=Micromonospora sp. AMSO31t TaxID=2650566 RepID=UPI00124B5D22